MRQLRQALEQQYQLVDTKQQQLDVALNNMVQGLAMFDADYRLVLCNRRYMDIYGLEPEHVAPGRRCGRSSSIA